MANLKAPTSIENGISQYGIYAVNTVSGGGNYLHFELNYTVPSSNIMVMVEAVGYSYGTAKPIRFAWNAYTYAYEIGNAANTNYNGAQANGMYYGSSGYLVLRVLLNGEHYTCLQLNSYMVAGNGYQQTTSIRRSVQTYSNFYY